MIKYKPTQLKSERIYIFPFSFDNVPISNFLFDAFCNKYQKAACKHGHNRIANFKNCEIC